MAQSLRINARLVVASVCLALATASAPALAATCASGWSDQGGGVCEKLLAYNGTTSTIGTVQYVTVPANVTAMTMIVAGASGQASLDNGEGSPAPGGKGGRQTGTVPVVPGDTLAVYVGQTGDTVPQTPTHGWQLWDPVNPGAYTMSGAFGGGGLSSSNFGGFGGGGSFVFDSQPIPNDPYGSVGNLLIAAGGGGGAGYDENQFVTHGAYGVQRNDGGHGSGAGPAGNGVAVPMLFGSKYSPGAGGGATLDAAGAGGIPAIPGSYWFGQVTGGSGIGPATLPDATNAPYTWVYLGAGGNAVKGTCCYYYGEAGAGGGGYYGGGAGGSIEADYQGGGGGGGSGYIAANATGTLAETGVWTGDGQVTLRYTAPALPTLSSLSPASGPVGSVVTLGGTNLATVAKVTFNGVNAAFTVVSATQLKATVPLGASTGPVAATNPSGTATAGTSFTVTTVPTTLSALKISAATLSPTFASGTTAYSAAVPYATTGTTITATATSSLAALALSVNGGPFGALSSGTASATQNLNVGTNSLVVRVTAPDATFRDYSVTITRAAPSTIATLSALKASAGTLAPTFASATYNYTASVAYAVSSTTVTATVTSGSNATLAYQVGGTTGTWTPLASATASPSLALSAGAATGIYVRVTAQDGVTTNTYRVTITRAAPSSVKTLSALKFSVGTLSPKFASTTLAYAITIPAASASYTITATATSGSGATLAYQVGASGSWLAMTSGSATAAIAASAGTTPVRVRVTAQDASYQDYVINVSH